MKSNTEPENILPETPKTSAAHPGLVKNLLFAGGVLALAGVLALFLFLNRTPGKTALITIVDGESHTVSLENDAIYTFNKADGARLDVTLEVKDGAIRFVNSVCTDHICEGFGWLSHGHDEAICAPAGVVVSVEE